MNIYRFPIIIFYFIKYDNSDYWQHRCEVVKPTECKTNKKLPMQAKPLPSWRSGSSRNHHKSRMKKRWSATWTTRTCKRWYLLWRPKLWQTSCKTFRRSSTYAGWARRRRKTKIKVTRRRCARWPGISTSCICLIHKQWRWQGAKVMAGVCCW